MRAFDRDREEVIARAIQAGVGAIITVGIDLKSSRRAVELAERYTGVYAAVGFHPHDASALKSEDMAELADMARHPRVVAIGEIGLDFYRNYSPREAQVQAMERQLELAAGLEMPVIVHCRQAERDILSILGEWLSSHKGARGQALGVVHCFNGTRESVRRYLDMGFCLSVGAYIGYPRSVDIYDAVRDIPEDRLLVETDCPFLSPQVHRGKRNEPSYLPLTIESLAAIRDGSPEQLAARTTTNAQRLFGIKVETGSGVSTQAE
ncbi:MAG: TatD family hydrolase [Dehalococcoidia bacterium]|nr:TatD family hydrolase [Dehalococcoidia bacterium]